MAFFIVYLMYFVKLRLRRIETVVACDVIWVFLAGSDQSTVSGICRVPTRPGKMRVYLEENWNYHGIL